MIGIGSWGRATLGARADLLESSCSRIGTLSATLYCYNPESGVKNAHGQTLPFFGTRKH